jgi:tetratricopeptide (TPR) repeat protein
LDLGAGDQSLLHINRGNMYASRGRWKEAAGDFTKAVGDQPRVDLQQWKCMVALAQAGDEEGYRRQRRASFSALPHDVPESVARHAARAALLVPIDGEDLTTAMNLAAIGASDSASGSDRRWVEQNRGLAEYRTGRFESAVDLLLRSIKTNKASGSDACLEAVSDFFLAMARARLDHAGDGVADFERGVVLMEGELRRLSNGDLGYGWYEWAICDIARREAQQILTESKSDVAGSLTRAGLHLLGEGKWASGESCLASSIQLRRQEIETSASPAGSDLRFELSHNLVDLGLAWMQLNRPKEAEEALRECIKLREERPPFWGLYDATSDLGAALAAQGRMEDAEPMLIKGYEKMIGFKDAWPNRKVEAIDRIISFYNTWNKPEKAREWRLRKEREYPVR